MSRSVTRVEILRYSPSHRVRRRIALVIAAFFAVAILCWIAWFRGAQGATLAKQELQALELVHRNLVEQTNGLEQQLTNLRKGAEIDAAAAKQARLDVARARSEIARLEQEVSLYQSLIDSSVSTKGLVIHQATVSLSHPASPGRYRYRIVLLQRSQRHVELTGMATMSIVGVLEGRERRFDLSQLGVPEADSLRPLNLIYFQVLEGEIVLPEGLAPHRMIVKAEIKTGKPQKVERSFDWVVEEK